MRISAIRRFLIYLSLALAISIIPRWAVAQSSLNPINLERISRATVFIIQARDNQNRLITACVGSGTLVSRDGLILTNAHHTLQSETCSGDTLVIAMSLNPDQPPVPLYRAEIAQVDRGLDLALLRITRELNGRLLEPGSLTLPFVELSATSLALDDPLFIAGYPSAGSDPVKLVSGTVVSFLVEPGGEWIKTRATLEATMTGGGAYDRDGRLVAIPTTAPTASRRAEGGCQFIEDTNLDGLINNNDSCVPTGDFVNSLRPVDDARPLIRAARLGLRVETLTAPRFETAPAGQPRFSRLFFSPAINNDQPATVVSRLPIGTTSLYLFFDYENMTSDTVYELRVTIDGIPNQTFSLPPVRWSGGERGLWYIGSTNQPWPNGVYEFRLLIDGLAAASQAIRIGEAVQDAPLLSNIVFGLLDLQGNLLGNGYVLPKGSIASARFIHQNMVDGAPWTVLWYYNGVEVTSARTTDTWRNGANGSAETNFLPEGGLISGNYRVELYLRDDQDRDFLAATADFVVAGGEENALPQIFTELHFAAANDPIAAVSAAPQTSFTAGIDALYVLFDWTDVAPGTLWTMRWFVDDELFFQQTQPWNTIETGENHLSRLTAPNGVQDGKYSVEVSISGVILGLVTAQVGIGQLPIDRFAQADGVQLRGRIVDAETGQGIEGVSFVLISEDFSIEDFTWLQDQVYAIGTTDRNGNFEIDRPVEFDKPYSVIIRAEGYLPLSRDGFTITPEEGDPIEMLIPLTRD